MDTFCCNGYVPRFSSLGRVSPHFPPVGWLLNTRSHGWRSMRAHLPASLGSCPMIPLARGDDSWFLSLLRPPWAVDLQTGEPRGYQLPAEVPGVDRATAGAADVEPGPARLPLHPAARAAGPALQEQPGRQVNMPLPHHLHSRAVPHHLPCKGGSSPSWLGGQGTPRKMGKELPFSTETGKMGRNEG